MGEYYQTAMSGFGKTPTDVQAECIDPGMPADLAAKVMEVILSPEPWSPHTDFIANNFAKQGYTKAATCIWGKKESPVAPPSLSPPTPVAAATVPDTTSEYTIGGYDSYHATNWKKVLSSYDVLKQLNWLTANMNASGDYSINLILQFDYDTSETNQTSLNLSLLSQNTIWGSFNWGEALWGSRSVFADRIKYFKRFRALRLIFKHRKAGQPFQCNGFGIAAQQKGFLYGST